MLRNACSSSSLNRKKDDDAGQTRIHLPVKHESRNRDEMWVCSCSAHTE